MRPAATALCVLTLGGLMAGCSPSVSAIAAIGYNAQGQLVGAVKVCDGDIVQAHLAPAIEGADDIAAWRRTSPAEGVETWPLQDEATGAWEPVGPAMPILAPDSEYVFWASTDDPGTRSNFLVFQGRDLTSLGPGEFLMNRQGPTNSRGETTTQVAVIPQEHLTREDCVE